MSNIFIIIAMCIYVLIALIIAVILNKDLNEKTDEMMDLICKNSELEKTVVNLKNRFEEEKKLNSEIKARFVRCNSCTSEMKEKCLMWTENLCEGERCNELIDIQELMNKDNLVIH